MAEVREREETVALRRLLPPHLIRVVLECAQLRLEVMLVCKQFYRLQWRYYDHRVRLSWAYLCAIGARSKCPVLHTHATWMGAYSKGIVKSINVNWATIIQYQSHDRERTPYGISNVSWTEIIHGVEDGVDRMCGARSLYPMAQAAVSHCDIGMMKHFDSLRRLTSLEYSKLLVRAVCRGQLEAVQYLVQKGADIEMTDTKEIPLLHAAIFFHHSDIATYLLDRGVKVDTVDYDGKTPLHVAAEDSSLEFVRCLVERGVDINAVDRVYNTPLHLAATGGCPDVVEYLLTKGADVRAVNGYRQTMLHCAAKMESKQDPGSVIMRRLVSLGVCIDGQDITGRTPYRWARACHHHNNSSYLFENGADTLD